MLSKKRGQISLVFIYLAASVIIVIILIFGYRAVHSFLEKQQEIQLLSFEKDLKNEIDKVRQQYGSRISYELDIPGYDKVCFIDLGKEPVNNFDPVIYNLWSSGAEKNVFLVNELVEQSFYAGNITVADPGWTCLNLTEGENEILIQSAGVSARISKV